eukprot:tig00000852_g5019.t1
MVSTAGMLKAGGRKRGSCRCSSASSRSAATFAPASATSLWGSRASPFASAEQACRMYSRGLRQLACWTKSEYQRIAFMLSTCRTAPKGESRPRSRAKKSVRIPGGCRLAPVLRLPRRLGLQVLFAVAGFEALPGLQGGQVGRVRLERGEVSGVGLGEEVPVDPLIALLLCLQQHPPSDLATGAPRARLYLPLAFFRGAGSDGAQDRVLALLRDFEGVPLDTDAILMGLAGRGGAQKSAVRRALQLLVTEGVACTPVGKCGDLNTTYEARPGRSGRPWPPRRPRPPRRRTCRCGRRPALLTGERPIPRAPSAQAKRGGGGGSHARRGSAPRGKAARGAKGKGGSRRVGAAAVGQVQGPRGDFIEEAQEWEEPEGAPASNEPEEVESILDRVVNPQTGKLFYKIKWLNCNHISWEPEENCEGCTELLAEFEEGYHACGGNLGPSPPPTAPLPRGFPAGVTV